MRKKHRNSIYPIILGEKGKDTFFLKYGNGNIEPWPTEEEEKKIDELYSISNKKGNDKLN